ncbi:Hypothetical protein R9X50_00632400 [Acrodontium crateriforme]|uniref:Rhamnogalacturonase A/B/Epimerase-like pectate lyase domain-containing protein n=1 Tax=Acrodontium crateriforme TaxID=150365 RepID=A0AAQ3M8N8_9PEZI|nr:Hypothetical protein R9X50_00632400 [Acrodontium crateriforme]
MMALASTPGHSIAQSAIERVSFPIVSPGPNIFSFSFLSSSSHIAPTAAPFIPNLLPSVQATDYNNPSELPSSTSTQIATQRFKPIMHSLRSISLLTTALCTIFSAAAPAPMPDVANSDAAAASGYWFADTTLHNANSVWGNSNSAYKTFRNVKDFGAKGDGSTDDTAAINNALSSGTRCGQGCNSSTISPAIVYFPAGTYMVSKPLVQYYYTQMIGDPTNLPTIKGTSGFQGIALIDSDPYTDTGANWYINQNNFYRQIRNFNVDLTGMGTTGAGIHWQVAQATSLQNIVFNMNKGSSSQQIGIFMDNGSGGFMSDLIFNGGQYGAFFGNQQFTSRNMTFNGCRTAVFMNWNWGWTLTGLTINGLDSGSSVGVDVSNSPSNQTVGSIVLADSSIQNCKIGVKSAYNKNQNVPATGGTVVINNVDMSGTGMAVGDQNGNQILAAGKISAWASGNGYTNSNVPVKQQNSISPPATAASLKDSNGNIFSRSKPQYAGLTSSSFSSAHAAGCKGDGQTDNTQCIQNFLNSAASANKIAYFDYGAYIVKNTIKVPNNIKIVGELWPMIVASGFTDVNNPKPVFQIGDGGNGAVEMSDMLFMISGPNPGAIMIQWNLKSTQGASGMWDTHVRMGGSYGSNLMLSQCAKNPSQTSPNTNCEAGFLMFQATSASSGVYLENTWFWTADHDMEDALNRQISVYNGRGVLIQSPGPVWLWGTASEHSILYNYQFDGVQALFAGFIQTETPYMQPNSPAPAPFSFNSNFDDPTFTICTGTSTAPCLDSWGLRVVNSKNIVIYSAGMYSFFNNYDQTCVSGQNCQLNMIRIQSSQVAFYAITTKAAVNMIVDSNHNNSVVKDADNRDNFGATLAYYFSNP